MNTLEIDKILSTSPLTKQTYIGCFAADQIPNMEMVKFPNCLVMNIDPITSKGSHWVCAYSPSPSHIEYYDSLGIWPPPSIHIANYLSRFKQIRYSIILLQSPNSSVCGRHVLFFLFNRCLGTPFEKIVRFLHFGKTTPDTLVSSFVTRIININS